MEIVLILAGFVVGSLITYVAFGVQAQAGVLRIDHSNPEKDIYRLDIGDFDKLDKKNRIVLRVDHNADLSQN